MKVTAVFDIGKTNKKLLLFDEEWQVVHEVKNQISEIKDEDGQYCDDLNAIRKWIQEEWESLQSNEIYDVSALNFTTYGASFVHLDGDGNPITPLYNYLKTYPPDILEKFYQIHGTEEKLAQETASPALKMLNSGLQLYWLKHTKPQIYESINRSLHLPNYFSYLFTGSKHSEMTSIGCHTMLWDFKKSDYHDWVKQEGINAKLAPITDTRIAGVTGFRNQEIPVGTGLHDSSSALNPYYVKEDEPFVLLSTGTWSIAMNPFNDEPLTAEELKQDCLCYLRFDGKPVKSSRLHLGRMFDDGVSLEELIPKQVEKIWLAIGKTDIAKILVTGGFSYNEEFLAALQDKMPDFEVVPSEIPEATALGAAMSVS